MTQTDYIKKAKPKNTGRKTNTNKKPTGTGRGRTSNRTSKKNQPAPSKPPFVAIGLLIITLGAFGYFLWYINGAADNSAPAVAKKPQPKIEQPTTEKVIAANKPEPKQQPDIPEPPKEQWQYIDELKKKKVEVEAAKLEQKGPYVMQCATFKDPRRAEAFKAQLALLGFESRIKTTQGSNGPRHRVQLGPYEKNRDAQADRHKLSRHNINGCKIWLWS